MQILIKTDKSNWCHLFLRGRKKLTKKNLFCPCWSWLKCDYWNLWAQNGVPCSAFAVSWGRISHPWLERAELLPMGAGQQSQLPACSQSCCVALAESWLGALCWQMGFGQMWSHKLIFTDCRCEWWGWYSSALSLQSALEIAENELLGLSVAVCVVQEGGPCQHRQSSGSSLVQLLFGSGRGQVLPTEKWLLSQLTGAWEPSLCSREFGWLIITSFPPSLGGRRCYRHLIIMKT